MKSVCIVVQNVYDIDPRVRRKAEALVSAGFSVDVFALAPPSGAKRYVLDGVNVIALSLGKARGSLVRYFFEYFAFFVWISMIVPKHMIKRRYSVIDVNSLPDFLVFAPFVAKLMGATLILDLHEITPEFYMSKYGVKENSWIVKILKFQEWVSVAFADQVITINEPILELLVERGLKRSKATVVMNAVDEERFAANSKNVKHRSRESNLFVMMYHGTLTKIYGLDIAVSAFSQVHERMPGAELWILGAGPEQEVLRKMVEAADLGAKIRIVGQVPSREIPQWLDDCDVGLLPIRRDVFLDFAFPNKLPEFVISGKPVLISRLKAIRYYFPDSCLCFFEPNDAKSLGEQMVHMYLNRDMRTELPARAREAYEPIRWHVMKGRYLDLVGRCTRSTLKADAQAADSNLGAAN